MKRKKEKCLVCIWQDPVYRKRQKIYTETTRVNKQIRQSLGYKINTQNSVCFYIPAMKQSQKEIKKAISFAAASKRVKYIEINLTKQMKDLRPK